MAAAHLNPYEIGLDKNPANYVPLTPVTFLERAAQVYPNKPAVIHGQRVYTWSQVFERSRRLASALAKHGVRKGSTVAILCPNIPDDMKLDYVQPSVGHYGVFNGRRFREEIYPRVRDFIAQNEALIGVPQRSAAAA